MAERFSFSSAAVGLVSTGSRAPAGLVTVRKLPVTNTVFNQVRSYFYLLHGWAPIRKLVLYYYSFRSFVFLSCTAGSYQYSASC